MENLPNPFENGQFHRIISHLLNAYFTYLPLHPILFSKFALFITAPIRFANGTLNLIQLEIYIIRFYSAFHLDFNKIKYFSKSVDLRLGSFKRKKV